MSHEQVLLKRPYRTPLGRFQRSVDGVPVPIPQKVIRRYGLPSDAEIVGKGYVPPDARDDASEESVALSAAQQEQEIHRRAHALASELAARQRGARDEKLAKAAESAAAKEENPEDEEALLRALLEKRGLSVEDLTAPGGTIDPKPEEVAEATVDPKPPGEEEVDYGILDANVPEIPDRLKGLTRHQLELLKLAEERGRKQRKGVLIAIEAAMDDLGDAQPVGADEENE